MKYKFLLGRQFRLHNQVFQAEDVQEVDPLRTVVKGVTTDGRSIARNFPASLVVESLIFEEEIELMTGSEDVFAA